MNKKENKQTKIENKFDSKKYIKLTLEKYNAYTDQYVDMFDEAQVTLEFCQSYMEELINKNAGIREEINRVIAKIDVYKKRILDRKNAIKECLNYIEILQNKIERLTNSRNTLQSQYRSGSIDRNRLKLGNDKVSEKIIKIKQEVGQTGKFINQLEDQIKRFEDIIERLKKVLKGLKKELQQNNNAKRITNRNIKNGQKNLASIDTARENCDRAFGVSNEEVNFKRDLFEPQLKKIRFNKNKKHR